MDINSRILAAPQDPGPVPPPDPPLRASSGRSADSALRLWLHSLRPRYSLSARIGWTTLLAVLVTNAVTAFILWAALHCSGYEARYLAEFAALTVGFASLVTAVCLALLVRHAMRQLGGVAQQACELQGGLRSAITVPGGHDEVAQIAQALAAAVEKLNADKHTLEARVLARTAQVEKYALKQRHLAVTMERLRIARDIHDHLANTMLALLQRLLVLRTIVGEPAQAGRIPGLLQEAEQAAARALADLRGGIAQIRGEAVGTRGLPGALGELLHRFSARTGIRCDFEHEPEAAHTAEDVAETVFRMCEEALRNVERHAGASQVRARLRCSLLGTTPAIELEVADNGKGFDPGQPRQGRYGLVGLREQAQTIDADLLIDSRPGGGTRLRITFPTRRGTARDAAHPLA